MLELAREVAHTAQRKYAPIATYALGLAVGAADPAARIDVARRAIEAVQAEGG
ncbi:MAG: molybdopterin-guanine dinucleotide biosynthesis protein [Nitriliruptorales bacterium]|nr:molybdopterin-guanine dinucleotide biosynthesis protein [Nitriliruptorales bacterium]